MTKQRIYLDHIAGTPIKPEVLQAMLPFLDEHFGNPASIHHHGEVPQDALFRSREQVARLIGAETGEIIFTSCGTESNNLALKGAALNQIHEKKHLVISSIEHYSVMYVAKALEQFGFAISLVPVDALGRVDPDAVRGTLRPDTALVSVMLANNEVGTIQPLAEIARCTRAGGILLHTDAVAATGRIPVNVRELGVDLLSLSANQFGGPKGAAALFCRKGVQLWPLFHGGGQEDGRRTGTENVAGIVGMGKAAELTMAALEERAHTCHGLEKLLMREISDRIDEVRFNGDPNNHLPGLVNVSISYVEGEALLLHMDMRGISVAGASACMSITAKASHVLEAMGTLGDGAIGTLLFTMGQENTEEEIHKSVDALSQVVTMLRAMSPLYGQRKA